MNNGMTPCQNPSLCGVQNHRAGTQARCKTVKTSSGVAGRIGATPKPASSYTPGEYDDYDDRDYPEPTPDQSQKIIDEDYDDRYYPSTPKPVVQTYSDYDYDDRD